MIRLERINGKNVWDILKLHVDETQISFVAPNDVSIIEAYIAITHHGQAFPFGIYDDETPVGFCMIGFGADDDWEDAPAIAKSNYNLWRFMIDRTEQNRGFGQAAMTEIIRYFRERDADVLYLSTEPENEVGLHVYHKFGFKETGEIDEGEAVLKLELLGAVGFGG